MVHRASRLAASLPGVVAIVLVLCPAAGLAGPVSPAPALPAPVGTVINVSTESQLQAAMAQLRSDTTIVLAPGTYRLTRTLYIYGTYSNVGIRGATHNPDDVVIIGPGMTNTSYGNVPFGVWTGGDVQDVTIANVTIRDFYFHPIILNPGTRRPFLHNLHLIDAGQQFIKGNPDGQGGGVDDGVLQYSTIEFTNRARDAYPEGIDIHTGSGWQIRHNLFRNIRAPGATQLIGPAVLMWNLSRNTIVESNTFINCQREIMFGVDDRTPNDHTGGIIRNNMIYRDPGIYSDVGIALWDSPDTQVLNNTILISGNFPNAIEYRYTSTVNAYIANNLVDAAIRSRDGAQAVLHNNVLTAHPGMFVAAAAGDLHLRADATAAIDAGTAAAGTTTDWDGDVRPLGAAPDAGADEFRSAGTPPTSPPPTGRVNVALASAGAIATASSTLSTGFPAAGAINGDRRGTNWERGGGWHDATGYQFPDWLQVDFAGARTINEITVVSVQDAYMSPVEPTAALTFSQYGLTDFTVQYWDGAQWRVVPGGAISGNRQVLRTVTFAPLTTNRIRVWIAGALAGFSRVTEVEAYQADGAAPPSGTNVAAASVGASASASTAYSSAFAPAGAINGDRRGTYWGAGGGWNDATADSFPDWLQIDFAGAKTISEVRVFTVQDEYWAPVEPTPTQLFGHYGLTSFTVQYWDGGQWLPVPGGIITGNRNVWRTVTFTPLTTSRIRVWVTGGLANYSRITEVEAY